MNALAVDEAAHRGDVSVAYLPAPREICRSVLDITDLLSTGRWAPRTSLAHRIEMIAGMMESLSDPRIDAP
jgi:hypothetical protein